VKRGFSSAIGVRIFSVIFCSWLISSCGTAQIYSGSERQTSEVARIKGSGVFPFKSVSVMRVNGKPLGLANSDAIVLPGSHIVTGHLFQSYGVVSREGEGVVTFEAQAGHIYVLRASFFKGDIFFWLEDEGSGIAIAGIKPD
jgi:hypothetical protein